MKKLIIIFSTLIIMIQQLTSQQLIDSTWTLTSIGDSNLDMCQHQELTPPIDSVSTKAITENLLYRYEEFCRVTETVIGYRYILNESKYGGGATAVTEVYKLGVIFKHHFTDEYYRYLPYGYNFTKHNAWEWIKSEDNKLWTKYDKWNDGEGKNRGYNMTYVRVEEIKQTIEPTFAGFIKYLRDK